MSLYTIEQSRVSDLVNYAVEVLSPVKTNSASAVAARVLLEQREAVSPQSIAGLVDVPLTQPKPDKTASCFSALLILASRIFAYVMTFFVCLLQQTREFDVDHRPIAISSRQSADIAPKGEEQFLYL
jgi:hypothetical protein